MSHVHVLKKMPSKNCFVDFILCQTDKYMFIVNNNKKKIHLHMFKIKSKYSMTLFWCFHCWLDHSWHINIVFQLLTLNKYLSVGCERHVIMFWKTQIAICFFHNKRCKAYFIQQFIIAPSWNKLWPH